MKVYRISMGKALSWLEKVNERVHSETGEIPRERLVQENLRSIAEQPRYNTASTGRGGQAGTAG